MQLLRPVYLARTVSLHRLLSHQDTVLYIRPIALAIERSPKLWFELPLVILIRSAKLPKAKDIESKANV